jgi:hypothetical protein
MILCKILLELVKGDIIDKIQKKKKIHEALSCIIGLSMQTKR